MELIYWLVERLSISTRVVLASSLGVRGANVTRLINIIQSLGGDHFYEGSAGQSYINVDVFEQAGISVTFQEYRHPSYPQLYGDFISHLSH